MGVNEFWELFDKGVAPKRAAMVDAPNPQKAGEAMMQAASWLQDQANSLLFTAGMTAGYTMALEESQASVEEAATPGG